MVLGWVVVGVGGGRGVASSVLAEKCHRQKVHKLSFVLDSLIGFKGQRFIKHPLNC